MGFVRVWRAVDRKGRCESMAGVAVVTVSVVEVEFMTEEGESWLGLGEEAGRSRLMVGAQRAWELRQCSPCGIYEDVKLPYENN